jgi:hypothetical protein
MSVSSVSHPLKTALQEPNKGHFIEELGYGAKKISDCYGNNCLPSR